MTMVCQVFPEYRCKAINASRPDHGQGEKIKFKFLFPHVFVVPQKVLWGPFIKPFEVPQRSV